MSIKDLYDRFEEEFDEDHPEYYNHSNFGESMPLSTFMEGHGAGFGMRDSEQTTRPEHGGNFNDDDYTDLPFEKDPRHQGTPQILRGYGEDTSPEPSIYVQEILDTIGPDSDEGAGPFEVICDFTLEDYIMFRDGTLYGKKFTTQGVDQGGNIIEVEHPNIINFDFSPVEAIQMAQMVYKNHIERTQEDHYHVAKRATQLALISEQRGWNPLQKTYLQWAFHNLHVHADTFEDDIRGFEYAFKPIIDSEAAVIDATMTRQQADDLSYHEGEEIRQKAETRDWGECFHFDEKSGKWDKSICPEEFVYRARKKEERELRTQNILAWIRRNDPKTVAEVFHKRGEFHKNLQKSRSTCLPPTGSYRTTFKSAIEVWLTKQQADLCMKAAEEKIKEVK